VSALVTYLAHDDCPVSAEFFGVGGGRVVRVIYAETEGYADAELDAEPCPGGPAWWAAESTCFRASK
jgi:hypothetical protein